jgi:CheY-like chemotaxis protein
MSAEHSNIFDSVIAIVSENQTMANILREQCLLYGFTKTRVFSDWNALLPGLSEELPDIIVSDNIPSLDQSSQNASSQAPFYDMIPIVLYSQGVDESSEAVPEGLTIVASLRKRDEQQRLLEVIHEELDKRYFDAGRFAFSLPPLHLNIVIGTSDAELGASMRQVLEKKGYYVSLVENGKDILKYIEGVYPHVVFLDEDLPQLNGLSVFQWIKSVSPHSAVLMMGNNDSPELISELLKAGVSSYLKKPFDLESLPPLCQGLGKAVQHDKESPRRPRYPPAPALFLQCGHR